MILINKLIPTQNEIRNPERLRELTGSKYWAEMPLDENPIKIIRTQQGDFLLDGHTRIIALLLSDTNHPDRLFDGEYTIKNMPIDKFNEVNLAVGWVTPFNPIAHCRKADLHEFKEQVKQIRLLSGDTATHAFITRFTGMSPVPPVNPAYAEQRKVHSFVELAEQYRYIIQSSQVA